MARPLLLLLRLGATAGASSLSAAGRRFSSRGSSAPWTGRGVLHGDRAQRYSDDMSDEELEDVEDKLQALVDQERKKQRTVKYHILRRKMSPPGPPQRKLTWDAIEQIRYLKQEQPEEWTVERLAEGFSVTPDAIRRVLNSKFVPPPERKAKQDANVAAGLSQQVLLSGAAKRQDRLKLPGSHTPAALPSGSREGAVVPLVGQTLMLQGDGSGSLVRSPAAVTALSSQLRAGFNKDTTEEDATAMNPAEEDNEEEGEEEEDEEEEAWDGRVFTEEELEEFIEMEKPSPVVQSRNNFFDAEGNFLYRI